MDPMSPLSALLSYQFILLCLAISAIVFVFRTIVDYLLKATNKTSTLWEDAVLPISPILLGGLVGWLMTSFPYPDNLTSKDSRIIFGLVAGSLSGLVYRMIKATVIRKIADAVGNANKDKDSK